MLALIHCFVITIIHILLYNTNNNVDSTGKFDKETGVRPCNVIKVSHISLWETWKMEQSIKGKTMVYP
jgi:hypothetical protein